MLCKKILWTVEIEKRLLLAKEVHLEITDNYDFKWHMK